MFGGSGKRRNLNRMSRITITLSARHSDHAFISPLGLSNMGPIIKAPNPSAAVRTASKTAILVPTFLTYGSRVIYVTHPEKTKAK